MRALIIMDPPNTVKPSQDTSLDLMAVGQARGHTMAFCDKSDISAGSEGVFAFATQVTLSDDVREHDTLTAENFQTQDPAREALDDFDIVFIRNDPPFDDSYISLTLLLEPARKNVLFVNDPQGVRAISEKLSALNFPTAVPSTLASYRLEELRDYAKDHERVVLKPAYFGSGTGVVVTSHDDPGFEAQVDKILELAPKGPVIAQGFLPEVAQGDTRMMMFNGDPVGALGRMAGEGEFRTNIAAGGREVAVEATREQSEIAREIGPYLREHGIVFAGLDFIGNHLIEINVTSPTLVQQLRRLGGPDISEMIWLWAEDRRRR